MDKYKSLAAWQHAHSLCLSTLEATDDSHHPRTWAVFDQLRRAAVSVEANIVEGYALSTAANFRHHLRIALGSAAEVECLLNIARGRGYLQPPVTDLLQQATDQTLRTLYGLLRSRTDRG